MSSNLKRAVQRGRLIRKKDRIKNIKHLEDFVLIQHAFNGNEKRFIIEIKAI